LETATLIGLDILTFWELTPYEFSLVVDSYLKKTKQESDERWSQAYAIASWQRAKKMPSLESVIGKQTTKKEMSDSEMLRVVMALNKAFGGTKEEVE
jgi:hypothetical protein